MLLLATILLLNYYSRSLPTETQKFFGNKFSESVKHFGNFRKYFSPKISLYTVCTKENMFAVLSLIILCLRVMEYSSVNKMQSVNLAIVFGPIIMRSRVDSVANASLIPVQSKVMEAFLTEHHTIFS